MWCCFPKHLLMKHQPQSIQAKSTHSRINLWPVSIMGNMIPYRNIRDWSKLFTALRDKAYPVIHISCCSRMKFMSEIGNCLWVNNSSRMDNPRWLILELSLMVATTRLLSDKNLPNSPQSSGIALSATNLCFDFDTNNFRWYVELFKKGIFAYRATIQYRFNLKDYVTVWRLQR